jgi:hypothetical protein
MLFAPVAAALAVVAMVTGLNALTGHGGLAPRPQPHGGYVAPAQLRLPAGATPGYYVDLNYDGGIVVRSVATGKVTATVPVSFSGQYLSAAASTSVNGVFYIAGHTSSGEKIYQFKLTSAGKVTGLSVVKVSGTLGQVSAIAAAPDGTKLAVTTENDDAVADAVTVISLPSGSERSWNGGLTMSGYAYFSVTSLS